MSRQLHGLRAWALQRVTAVYLALFVVYLICSSFAGDGFSFEAWRGWLANPLVSIVWALAVVSVLIHLWVGIRDVFIDYVKPVAVRFALLGLLGFALLAYGIWAARILLMVSA